MRKHFKLDSSPPAIQEPSSPPSKFNTFTVIFFLVAFVMLGLGCYYLYRIKQRENSKKEVNTN